MNIPHTMLSAETLRAVIEEFVLREGTEYGDKDVPLDDKVAAVTRQLEKNEAVVVFDSETESCSIVPKRPRR
jgi:uncharacterized protein